MTHESPDGRAASRDSEFLILFAAAKQGSSQSFSKLYEQTQGRLLRIILRVNGDRADAEEILQETFLRAWTRAAQFDQRRGQVAQWLGGMAHHAAVDSLKRRAARPLQQLPIGDGDSDAGYDDLAIEASDGPFETAVRNAVHKALHQCLQSLPATHRQVLLLSFCDGLSLAEIAERIDHPLGTVKSWARRALFAMRRELDGHR